MSKVLQKYKSFILYAFFGVATTLINIIVYWVCARVLCLSTMAGNILAWIAAVLFAYITNKKWVFESQVNDFRGIMREIISFISCRLATGLLDMFIMYVFVDIIHFNDMIVKCIANIIVIIANYIASKLIIFKKAQKISN